MQIIILENAAQVAECAADWVQALIEKKPNAVLGLATGSTPISLYHKLVSRYQDGLISFANVNTFNLDEYYDIEESNPQSYRYFMRKYLFDHVNIKLKNTFLPTCKSGQNPRVQGVMFEDKIKQLNGIDLQILGIGANGHIGFNEPTSSLASRTRIKTLTKQTLTDNSRLFNQNERQPNMAMTMGIGTIMDARYVLLMATGKNKAEAVNQMITGPLSANCPASVLQQHENAVILLDREAANALEDKGYFLWSDEQNRKLNDAFGLYHNF